MHQPQFVVVVRIVKNGPSMLPAIHAFLKEEDGPTAVEYAVMLMLVFLVLITVIQAVGSSLNSSFEGSATDITNATTGS